MNFSEYPTYNKPMLEENPYDNLIVCLIKFLENRVDNLSQFLEENNISLETYMSFKENYLDE